MATVIDYDAKNFDKENPEVFVPMIVLKFKQDIQKYVNSKLLKYKVVWESERIERCNTSECNSIAWYQISKIFQ